MKETLEQLGVDAVQPTLDKKTEPYKPKRHVRILLPHSGDRERRMLLCVCESSKIAASIVESLMGPDVSGPFEIHLEISYD
jgi:hypothetical protein